MESDGPDGGARPRLTIAGADRRTFLRVASGAVAASAFATAPSHADEKIKTTPIIDTHVHLFDPTRPQGVPYRGAPSSPTYKTGAFPNTYQRLAGPLGVVGAIAVEASPWIEDNLWLLEACANYDIMVGVIGNLKPEDPAFPGYLDRFHKNPLFRGIRYGNLWDYDIVAQSRNRAFLEGLKLLAQADLVLDTANPRSDLLDAIVRISDVIPDLRIIIDHLPVLEPAAENPANYEEMLREIQSRPTLYCKLSAVIHSVDGKVSTHLAEHRPRLDRLTETFGDDRVLFGSDWPNNEFVTSVDHVFQIMKEYFASKTHESAEKYFWKNSCRVYRWVARTGNQPHLSGGP